MEKERGLSNKERKVRGWSSNPDRIMDTCKAVELGFKRRTQISETI